MKLLTQEDLEAALLKVVKPTKRVITITRWSVVALMAAIIWYQDHQASKQEALLASANLKIKTATEQLTVKTNELNAINAAMTVSIDARRLGRPVRLSGEMIVVFAGEVKK